MILEFIRELGEFGLDFLKRLGKSGLFLLSTIFRWPKWRQGATMLTQEIYFIGVLSLLIIGVSGLFTGMVLGLQGFNTLDRFGATQELGAFVVLSILRELGPVLTALLFAGRAGSALTAEIGLMRTTEQIASMEMMAVDPLWRIIAPRFWGGIITMPILMLIFSAVGIYGSYLVGVKWLGVDAGTYWSNMSAALHFPTDIINGIIKSLVFGFVVTWIAVYQGYYTVPTSEGLSRATTRSVVYSSLAVLGLDFLLTALMLRGW